MQVGLGVEERQVIEAVERTVGRGARTPFGKPTLAPRMQKVIELAAEEAGQWAHKYVGTEYLLLGMLREGKGMGVQVLCTFVPLDLVSTTMINLFTKGHVSSTGPEETRGTSILRRTEWAEMLRTGQVQRAQQVSVLPLVRTWITGQDAETAILAERTRLARDLHDSVEQQLFSISISAAAVRERWDKDPTGALVALVDVQQSAQAAMVEMDALLKQLRPNPLETAGLIDALREQCEALAFRTGAEVTTYFSELPTEAQLPALHHVTIFRIVQEALANIVRHARQPCPCTAGK